MSSLSSYVYIVSDSGINDPCGGIIVGIYNDLESAKKAINDKLDVPYKGLPLTFELASRASYSEELQTLLCIRRIKLDVDLINERNKLDHREKNYFEKRNLFDEYL
jgi:hypothetical protein